MCIKKYDKNFTTIYFNNKQLKKVFEMLVGNDLISIFVETKDI